MEHIPVTTSTFQGRRMSEDSTQNLSTENDSSKDLTAVEMLRLVLADVRHMKTRLGALETLLKIVLKIPALYGRK